VVLDHRADRGIADQRGAQSAQSEASRRALLDQAQRHGGLEQALVESNGRFKRAAMPRRCAAPSQQIEQLQPHAGEQNLRIDEAGADVEQGRARAARSGASAEMRPPSAETSGLDSQRSRMAR
jgi:hypothetical protein